MRDAPPERDGGLPVEPDVYDLVGVGVGPFNLALAALADALPELRTRFLDAKPEFAWHPGMLLPDAVLQVPFLADLVTLVDPTSRWSFLNYLREHDRLFPFYFGEQAHVPRREYDDYCRWVSRQLSTCEFASRVTALRYRPEAGQFELTREPAAGPASTLRARSVVLGLGTEPTVPPAFADSSRERVVHSADYLHRRTDLVAASDVTVVGSGQSGAEVFLDLLRARGGTVRWLTRSPAFAPMEYSKLGLEHFTPDYTAYFRNLPGPTRDRLVANQWQLYKAISAETIARIHDEIYRLGVGGHWPDLTLMPNVEVTAATVDGSGLELDCRQVEQDRKFGVRTGMVVLATGYSARRPALLDPVAHLVDWDHAGRYQVDGHYRLSLCDDVDPRAAIYVQNAEAHTHGVGAPDLGLGAHRAAVILNAVTGRVAYRLPERTAYTTFGAPVPPAVPRATSPATPPATSSTPPSTQEDRRADARSR